MKKRQSVKSKIITVLIIYSVSALLIFSSVAFLMYKSTMNNAHATISAALESSSNLISNTLKSVSFTNNVVLDNQNMTAILSDYSQKDHIEQFNYDIKLNEILNHAWKNDLGISKITLFIEGKKISSGSGAIYNLSLIESSEWYNDLQGASMILKTQNPADALTDNSRRNPDTDISMCSEIRSDGAPAYMRIDISKDYLANIMQSVRYSDNSKFFLIDSEKQIITGNTDLLSKQDITKISSIDSSVPGGTINFDNSTENYIGYYSTLNPHGLRVLELVPKDDILSPCYEALFRILLIMLVILLVIGFFTYILILPISRKLSGFSSGVSLGTVNQAPYEELEPLNNIAENISDLNYKNRLYNLSLTSSRISPHFLYNTLDAIVWNLDDLDKERTAHLLSSLSRFYRLALLSSSFVCKLDKEIQLISHYLDLQKECFGSQITSSIEIPDELLNLYVPSFVLQPLVENTFKHGFINKTHNLFISIKANIISDKLVILLKDNGCGMDKYTLEKINSFSLNDTEPSLHEGIRNIRQRIDMLCQGDYSMEFSSSLTGGTTVKISLPIAENSDFYNIKNDIEKK